MKAIKRKAFQKMMKSDGWTLDNRSGRGDHEVWILEGYTFALPRHCPISPGVVRQYHKKMKEIKG